MNIPKHIFTPLLSSLLLFEGVYAAGFQLAERSTTGQGRAFSGEAAIADDASVLASNPAGMSLLDGTVFTAGFTYISPSVDVKGVSFATGAPVPASNSNTIGEALVPYLYASHRLNNDFSLGLGLYTAYGLNTDHTRKFSTIAAVDYSELTTVSISPTLSYRFNDKLSAGVSVNAIRADGRLTARDPATGLRALDLDGDDWGAGFTAGLVYEFSPRTRIGLSYHSETDLTLEGSVKLLTPAGIARGSGDLDLTLPDTIEFSAYHEFNDSWAIHGDAVWTQWSKFKELAPSTALAPLPVNEENWENTLRLSLGLTYRYNERWTFRTGIAYDEAPTPDPDHRTLRIPDADRFWVSVGATYHVNEHLSVDMAYTHIFADEVKINEPGAGNGAFVGEAEGYVNLFALGATMRF